MPSGSLSGVGTANSVIRPVTVMRPTQLAARSVNRVMGSVMTRMGDRFSANLLRKLDAQQTA